MIPDKILKFLAEQGNIGIAGTRDGNLVPHGHRICGWRLHADRRTLTAFVGEPYAERFLQSVLDNGRIALTVEEAPFHETYQLKGRYLAHRPIRPDEAEIVNRTRERFALSVRQLSPDPETHGNWLRASIPDATLAVDMEVQEVFLQTPGPSAGSRLYPPAEEK